MTSRSSRTRQLNRPLNRQLNDPARIASFSARRPWYDARSNPGMARAVGRLERTARALGRRAALLADVATELLEDLKIVRRTLREDASGRLTAAVELALLRAREERRRRRERAAAAGASTFETKSARAGAMFIRIDGSEWFRLSRGDARLLLILATASPGADGFPGWLSYEELADAVVLKGGKRPTRHATVEAMYRLRRAFETVDVNAHLLTCDRKAGRVRFLLRPGPRGGDGHGSRSAAAESCRSGLAG